MYADIRAEILAGRYAPGAKLSPRAIAAQYQARVVASHHQLLQPGGDLGVDAAG